MSRITIKDIAKLIQVNPSTISRALKDHPDIGDDTKSFIKKVAKDLGYQPNYQAIRFRQQKSGIIGLILPEMGIFFFPSVVKAIEEVTRKNGFSLVIFQSNEHLEKEIESIKICQSLGVDGLLACLSKETVSLEHFDEIIQNNTPVVFFDKVIPKKEIASVVINDQVAASTAINHLAKKGYQRICGGFGNPNLEITRERKKGFQKALKKHHLNYDPELCFYSNTVEDAKEEFAKILKNKPYPDAVFAMTDEVLAGVIQAVYEQNLIVPKELGVICISSGNLPYLLNPKITHIRHSGYEVGKASADLLCDLINSKTVVIQKNIELETFLIELDSC